MKTFVEVPYNHGGPILSWRMRSPAATSQRCRDERQTDQGFVLTSPYIIETSSPAHACIHRYTHARLNHWSPFDCRCCRWRRLPSLTICRQPYPVPLLHTNTPSKTRTKKKTPISYRHHEAEYSIHLRSPWTCCYTEPLRRFPSSDAPRASVVPVFYCFALMSIIGVVAKATIAEAL